MQSDGDFPLLTQATAHRALREAGLDVPPDRISLELREGRWLAGLPAGHLAWFPADESGRAVLRTERRILRLLQERCSFRVPRILFEAGWDLRAAVPGVCEPWNLYRRALADKHLARQFGRAIGGMLAEQHTRIGEADVAGWLPAKPEWPEPRQTLDAQLPDVVSDRVLLSEIEAVLDAFDGVRVEPGDRALVHGDLGLHNIAVDPGTDEVLGIFDYGGASWSDRHHDFRYLIFDVGQEESLEAALELYEPATGRGLDRDRIRLYNAACAIGFLAFRKGVPPEERSCGRTLEEDLRWVRAALARL